MGGKWRRCDDCPRGFPSLVKLDQHRKDDHPFEVLTAHLKWVTAELAALEAKVRRYWDAKAHLESLVYIPPGARELLQHYVTNLDRPFWPPKERTWLAYHQNRIPDLRKSVKGAQDRVRRATMMRAVP